MAEDPIAIAQQILGRAVLWKCLLQLVSGPVRSWMRCDGKVNDTAALVCQNEKDVQDLEPNRRHGEKVHRYEALPMFSRKVRHVCEGGFRVRTRYLLTLVSPMSMPSLSNSP